MGKDTGFIELDRETEAYRDVEVRIKDYDEIFTSTHNFENGLWCSVLSVRRWLPR